MSTMEVFSERDNMREELCKCSRPDILDLVNGPCCMGCGLPAAQTSSPNITTSSSERSYGYKPLWISDEIRLIRLLPSEHRTDDVQCVIKHTTLSQNLRFEALSYVWGSEILSHLIYTSEGFVKVTENCMEAMRDLRSKSDERVLWIDAICINQTCNEEKNHQVRLMNKIYASAYQVIIYLNPDPSYPVAAFFERLNNEQGATDSIFAFTSTQAGQRVIKKMLDKPWFSRVWVLQEISNSKRAILTWGTASTDWRRFSVTATNRFNYQGHIPPTLFIADSEPRPFKNLCTLIHYAKSTHSFDPRDKVYALIGLLHQSIKHSIVPDYNKSVEQVYTDLFRSFLDVYNHLDLLLYFLDEPTKDISESSIQMASWLPHLEFNPWIRYSQFFREKTTLQYDDFDGRVARVCASEKHHHTGAALEVCLLQYGTVAKHVERLIEQGYMRADDVARLEAAHPSFRSTPGKDLAWLYRSEQVLPDDEVCLINGTTELLILRQTENDYDGLVFRIINCTSLFMDTLRYRHGPGAMESSKPMLRDWNTGEILRWGLACIV